MPSGKICTEAHAHTKDIQRPCPSQICRRGFCTAVDLFVWARPASALARPASAGKVCVRDVFAMYPIMKIISDIPKKLAKSCGCAQHFAVWIWCLVLWHASGSLPSEATFAEMSIHSNLLAARLQEVRGACQPDGFARAEEADARNGEKSVGDSMSQRAC